MRRKKQMAMIAVFTLGAFLFAGSALADIRDKSGYEQLKDALKLTAVNCTENYQSFTAEISMVLKDNGQVLFSDNSLIKYDNINGAKEETNTTKDSSISNRNRSYYSYSDRKGSIVKSSNENSYIVTTYQEEREAPLVNKNDNPFNEERAKDMERIFDALVSNLKDQVIVADNPDGTKIFSGKLSEGQIPTLINALASFVMKQEFDGGRDGLVHLASDVYVKEVWGTAKVNEDGSLENMMGTATISGLDKGGRAHEISLEVLFQLSDVNTTRVIRPDLTGEKIVTREERDFDRAYKPTAEKFVGKFKNDILVEEDGRFVKIGERQLEITLLSDKEVQGNYREELFEGYENYASPFNSYTFQAKFRDDRDYNNAALEGTTDQGDEVRGNIYFNGYDAKIYLNIDRNQQNGGVIYDSDFRPDLD
jgi:hypothetical protein